MCVGAMHMSVRVSKEARSTNFLELELQATWLLNYWTISPTLDLGFETGSATDFVGWLAIKPKNPPIFVSPYLECNAWGCMTLLWVQGIWNRALMFVSPSPTNWAISFVFSLRNLCQDQQWLSHKGACCQVTRVASHTVERHNRLYKVSNVGICMYTSTPSHKRISLPHPKLLKVSMFSSSIFTI